MHLSHKASPIFCLMSYWQISAMGQCMPSMATCVQMLTRLMRDWFRQVLKKFLAGLFNLQSKIGWFLSAARYMNISLMFGMKTDILFARLLSLHGVTPQGILQSFQYKYKSELEWSRSVAGSCLHQTAQIHAARACYAMGILWSSEWGDVCTGVWSFLLSLTLCLSCCRHTVLCTSF